jgi:hypothetical protein
LDEKKLIQHGTFIVNLKADYTLMEALSSYYQSRQETLSGRILQAGGKFFVKKGNFRNWQKHNQSRRKSGNATFELFRFNEKAQYQSLRLSFSEICLFMV